MPLAWFPGMADNPCMICPDSRRLKASLSPLTTGNVAVDMLQATGGLMFALQHRFYGCAANMSTCPLSTFDGAPVNETLRHLSSHQASHATSPPLSATSPLPCNSITYYSNANTS